MITAGIDCGARNTKTIIVQDGRIMGKGSFPTGFDPLKAVAASFEAALEEAGISEGEVEKIYGTGSGRDAIEMAHELVDDIEAMAVAARFFFPEARTVTDVGAEEGRAAKLDERGGVIDSAVNEECAAGAGTFMEAMARALEVDLEEMGPLSLQSEREIPMNAQCVVFAESEVVALIRAGTEKADIIRTIHHAMAGRVASMIRRIGVNEEVALIGGVAHNAGFVEALRRELGIEKIHVPEHPEYGAALGAALAAAKETGGTGNRTT